MINKNGNQRTTALGYLKRQTKTVGIINENGEYEITPTKRCKSGDTVWVLEKDGTFTKTKIF